MILTFITLIKWSKTGLEIQLKSNIRIEYGAKIWCPVFSEKIHRRPNTSWDFIYFTIEVSSQNIRIFSLTMPITKIIDLPNGLAIYRLIICFFISDKRDNSGFLWLQGKPGWFCSFDKRLKMLRRFASNSTNFVAILLPLRRNISNLYNYKDYRIRCSVNLKVCKVHFPVLRILMLCIELSPLSLSFSLIVTSKKFICKFIKKTAI